MAMSKKAQDAIAACQMKVILPGRRGEYVMRWIDPETKRPKEKQTGTRVKRTAWQVATDKAMEVLEGNASGSMQWMDFCRLYREQHLIKRSSKTAEAWLSVEFWIDTYRRPRYLHEIDDHYVASWQLAMIDPARRRPIPQLTKDTKPPERRYIQARRRMKDKRLSESSVAAYSTRLRAALHWAARKHFISKVPLIEVGAIRARGRPLYLEEVERMLAAVDEIRKHDALNWKNLIKGYLWSGLRLSELLALSWDPDAPVRLDVSGEFPLIWFSVSGQKGRREDVQAVPEEFWEVVQNMGLPHEGYVFPLPRTPRHGFAGGGRISPKRVGRIMSEIGRAACVKVDPDTGKSASAHDLRRSFAGVMEDRLTPTELQSTMRHKDFRTTQRHYLRKTAVEIARRMRREAKRSEKGGAPGGADATVERASRIVKEQQGGESP